MRPTRPTPGWPTTTASAARSPADGPVRRWPTSTCAPGQEVTADQMASLFAEGRHPNADQITADLINLGASRKAEGGRDRAGHPVPPPEDTPAFQIAVARQVAEVNAARGAAAGHGPGGGGAGPDPHRRGPADVRRGVRPGAEGPAGAVLVHRPQLPLDDQRDRRVRPDVHPGQVGVRAVGDRAAAGRRADHRRAPRRRRRRAEAGWSGKRATPAAAATGCSSWTPPA